MGLVWSSLLRDSEDDQQTISTFEADCFEECLNSAPTNEELIEEELERNVEQNVQHIEEHIMSENESSGSLFQPIYI